MMYLKMYGDFAGATAGFLVRADFPRATPTRRHADTPTRRHADTPTRRHADTPTRHYMGVPRFVKPFAADFITFSLFYSCEIFGGSSPALGKPSRTLGGSPEGIAGSPRTPGGSAE
jgi:hypothetical protein